MPRPLVLVLDAHLPAALRDQHTELAAASGLVAKLRELSPAVFAFGDRPLLGLPALADAAAITRRLADDFDTLLLVEASQLFLDLETVRSGLDAFDPAFHDVFTQWEHCRLPVGVGVRAMAARTWRELDVATPEAAWLEVQRSPAGRKFAYDVRNRIGYAQSLLDARFSARLAASLPSPKKSIDWGLSGFLEIAVGRTAELRYRPAPLRPGQRVDERQMPAAYGFESAECASFPPT